MRFRRFADREFQHIGEIQPERQPDGEYLEFMPQDRYKDAATTPLNAYGSGPFCKFRIGRDNREAALYVLTLDDDPVYAGECVNLAKRLGPNGYGGISPRNCYSGGQPTNCRVNAAILAAVKEGGKVDLWFCNFDGDTVTRRLAETELIESLVPPWNRAKLAKFGSQRDPHQAQKD